MTDKPSLYSRSVSFSERSFFGKLSTYKQSLCAQIVFEGSGSLSLSDLRAAVHVIRKTSSYRLVSAKKRDLDRRIAAYRKCIHGNLSNEIMQLGSTIKLENISYLALQKCYGKSVGQSAPASLKASLFRTAEKLGGKGHSLVACLIITPYKTSSTLMRYRL